MVNWGGLQVWDPQKRPGKVTRLGQCWENMGENKLDRVISLSLALSLSLSLSLSHSLFLSLSLSICAGQSRLGKLG